MAAKTEPTAGAAETAKDATTIVQTGDTWDKIAARSGCDVESLLGANFDLGRPAHRPPITVGQVLRLP